MAVRIVAAARDAEMFHRQAGWPAAAEVLSRRRGHGYDPTVVDVLTSDGQRWLAEVDDDPCARVLDAEPRPMLTIADVQLDASLHAMADFTDLKSPWFRGHSTGVADLAGRGRGGRRPVCRGVGQVGAGGAGARHRAGRHRQRDLGSSRSTDRRAVGACEVARIPERASPAPLLAARPVRRRGRRPPRARRRLGLPPRGDGDQLDVGARLLSTADAYHAMTEERPHRPALSAADAASRLRDEADAGRFGTCRGRRRARRRRPRASPREGRRIRPASPIGRSRCCA